ncbi:hypothetical protein RvY_04364 [Ramazzottius varieornatus]|uniref:Uncharacterized protein n=1 Tax=Ramazzottius varieornatus TaxID=947166 RepID=A0A1D1UX42_RAMVA|nr:hypothetical protein RvY_04364 [Ramazzottius varieornatus]
MESFAALGSYRVNVNSPTQPPIYYNAQAGGSTYRRDLFLVDRIAIARHGDAPLRLKVNRTCCDLVGLRLRPAFEQFSPSWSRFAWKLRQSSALLTTWYITTTSAYWYIGQLIERDSPLTAKMKNSGPNTER